MELYRVDTSVLRLSIKGPFRLPAASTVHCEASEPAIGRPVEAARRVRRACVWACLRTWALVSSVPEQHFSGAGELGTKWAALTRSV
jgi:hypothetical protein